RPPGFILHSAMKKRSSQIAFFATLVFLASLQQSSAQNAGSSPNIYDFGKIGIEASMEHTFQFHNDSAEVVQIKNVQLTPPLIVTQMSSRVEPGGTGTFTVRLQEPRERGEFKGSIVVSFKDEKVKPLVFWAIGELVEAIEFDPFAAFFVTSQRG